MDFEEAVNMACKELSLDDALSYICIWESERVIKFVKENPNKPWETLFKYCISTVRVKYGNTR
jgi:dihydroneopterin aldolase